MVEDGAHGSLRALSRVLVTDALQSLALVFLQAILMSAIYGQFGSVLGATSVVVAGAAGLMAGGLAGARYLPKGHGIGFLRLVGWLRAGIALGLGIWWAGGGEPASPLAVGIGVAFTFLASVVTSIYDAAIFAVLPQLVPRALSIRANGILSVVHQMARVAGWGLGGLIATWWSPATVAGVVALMFACSSLAATGLSVPASSPTDEGTRGPGGGKGGASGSGAWRVLLESRVVRSLTAVDLVEALANVVWTSSFTLAFTVEVLKTSRDWWGMINAAYWAGALLGTGAAIVCAQAVGRRTGSVLWLSALGMALLTVAFTKSGSPVVATVLCVLMGPVYQVREICQAAILQNALPPARLGGVAAARNAILGPWSMGAAVLMGLVADVAGTGAAYVCAAILYGLTALIMWAQPALRTYGRSDTAAVSASS